MSSDQSTPNGDTQLFQSSLLRNLAHQPAKKDIDAFSAASPEPKQQPTNLKFWVLREKAKQKKSKMLASKKKDKKVGKEFDTPQAVDQLMGAGSSDHEGSNLEFSNRKHLSASPADRLTGPRPFQTATVTPFLA